MQQAVDGCEEEGLLDYCMGPLECVGIWSSPTRVGPLYYSTTSPVSIFINPRSIAGDVSSTFWRYGLLLP
jgi:hypothetical protein